MPQTAQQTVRVGLEQGLHMVPCAKIVRTAERFSCEIHIQKADRSADAKTMLDLLTLSAENGSVLVLEARGAEADEAVKALARLFESNFDDPTSGSRPGVGSDR